MVWPSTVAESAMITSRTPGAEARIEQARLACTAEFFFNAEAVEGGSGKVGYLVEYSETEKIFNAPGQQATQDYVSGRFG